MKLKLTPFTAFAGYLLLVAIIILAFAFSANSQTLQDTVWFRPHYGNGAPLGKPNDKTYKNTYVDTVSGQGYVWDGKLKVWNVAKISTGMRGETGAAGIDGTDGTDGINGQAAVVNVGTTTTLPAGSNATVTNSGSSSNAILNFGIPRGADGSGGGGTTRGFLFPAPCNCQTGADDVTLQNAFLNAGGNTIVLSGTYYITKGLKRNRLTNTFIQGNGATIITLNNNAFSVIGADQAPDENTAVQMQNYSLEITNLNITCQSNQIGVEPEPSSNNYFRKVIVGGGQLGFKLEFNLKAYLHGCLVVGAQNGYWAGWGGFPTADINNSQSNVVEFVQCHTHTVSNYGFDISHSYHIVLDNCISEGNGTIKRAVNVEVANSTTTKDFEIRSAYHFEQVGGATDAIVYLNLGNNCTAEITNVMPHYSGLVVWAKSFGTGLVIVNRCGYAVGKNGKMFKSENVTWSFNYNSIIYPYAYNVWDGTAPTFCQNTKQVGTKSVTLNINGTNQTVNNFPVYIQTGEGCGTNAFSFGGEIPR